MESGDVIMKCNRFVRRRIIGRIVFGISVIGVLGTAVGLMMTNKNSVEIDSLGLQTAEMTKLEGSNLYEALIESSTETMDVQVVASPEASPYDGRFIANITDTLNVRAAASTESEVVGKMYPGCVGDIVGTEGEWTQITSGNVNGYVKTEYILTGKDAEPMAEEYGKNVGIVTGDTLRIRREPSTESDAIALLEKDDEVYVTETLDGWYGVLTAGNWEGYVSAEFLTVEFKLETAITIEEEQARIAAEQAAKQEQAATQAVNNSTTIATTQQAPTQASYDDSYLLACLVSMEAGYEPYEGQLAVANVVLNRLRSGYYGSTISDVIYAPGQFPSVYGKAMTGYLNNGPLPQAQQAANEALAGVNNIGGYTCFNNVKYCNFATYDSYTIIGNHCFH